MCEITHPYTLPDQHGLGHKLGGFLPKRMHEGALDVIENRCTWSWKNPAIENVHSLSLELDRVHMQLKWLTKRE